MIQYKYTMRKRKEMLMRQEELPMVALASMNDTHLEDLIMINTLSQLITDNDVEKIGLMLDQMVEHTVQHFAQEEQMMLEKNFPAYQMHKNEHERALVEMKNVNLQWKQDKNTAVLQNYIEVVMPAWLVQHVRTMDTVTAQFLTS